MTWQTAGHRRRTIAITASLALGAGIAISVATAGPPPGQNQVGTDAADFFQPGTQPLENGLVPFITATSNCQNCHADYGSPDPACWPPPKGEFCEAIVTDPLVEPPYNGWVTSMMAQAARDPVWHAAIAIANQDANVSGEFCIRCHAPGAWLQGRSTPTDTSGFISTFDIDDFDGVQCHFCHRRVDPVLGPDSPPEDVDILADLSSPPPAGQFGNGRYVVDPDDVRRGPLPEPGSGDPEAVPANMHFGQFGEIPIIFSPLHRKSDVCASCHDVSNPVFKLDNGEYIVDALLAPHETQDPYDMFPEQRTYSEWLNSQYATGGVSLPGRYDANHPTGVMADCQDCHMPMAFTGACFAWENDPFFPRDDMPQHFFNGANHWVLKALRAFYPDSETGLSEASVDAAIGRTIVMLDDGADLGAQQLGPDLKVRVTNYSGHKLPTGYPEGRRLWLNVEFYDGGGALLDEHGEYDLVTAHLEEGDTKVYRAVHGIGADLAATLNLPSGPSAHLVLNNEVLFDNRIPPVGFTNAAYLAINAEPVGQAYADDQYWDDTHFTVPPGAASVEVRLMYQAMTKEYIEFLRDTNVTNSWGDDLHDLWEDAAGTYGTNKAAPVEVECLVLSLDPPLLGDVNGNGMVGFDDILAIIAVWGPCPPPSLCPADLNCSGLVGFDDIYIVIANWTG
ncbi:MAG: hypothetical protein GY715_18120 [Planctomycetes bacterium]|nr:hypothetical protein [Planctomycetota bacterium]